MYLSVFTSYPQIAYLNRRATFHNVETVPLIEGDILAVLQHSLYVQIILIFVSDIFYHISGYFPPLIFRMYKNIVDKCHQF